ncbi:hypothetical protein CALVIDRAFT_589224 [Calocera viscosa TUFC12733]|uniref:Ecp2 effector protein domain-containing protein n=1 Tax=Calocera viscosa (strain TUFC12733) TaxID=1330018 RepID=A0A167H3R0_CALVF|nr:hypothetical protein CALVIDRAFT_589224 [Calocera viscosa TUFC12733]
MQTVMLLASVLAILIQAVASQITCSGLGLTACPYTPATTSDLKSLIASFCGDDGGYPEYKYTESQNAELPGDVGYYTVGTDRPGGFNQEVCDSAFNNLVDYCTAAGFWIEGLNVVDVDGDSITFSVIPCQLA